MVGSLILADIVDMASAGEVVLELVEGAGHHSVGEVEGLLDPVSVVDVDVDVEDSLEGLE